MDYNDHMQQLESHALKGHANIHSLAGHQSRIYYVSILGTAFIKSVAKGSVDNGVTVITGDTDVIGDVSVTGDVPVTSAVPAMGVVVVA